MKMHNPCSAASPKSSPSVKPMHGDAGGGAKTTMSSDKAGGYGAPGHAKAAPPWPRNPKQKDGRR